MESEQEAKKEFWLLSRRKKSVFFCFIQLMIFKLCAHGKLKMEIAQCNKNLNCIIYIFINCYLCGSFLNFRVKNFIV